MPGSCNQLLLFTDRKGNHKSSEWHWGLESFAPFPTKQVVYMRELAIVLALEEKRSTFFLQRGLPKAQTSAGAITEDQEEGPSSFTRCPERPLTPQPEALPVNCVCRRRAARPSVSTSRFFSCFPSETGFWESEGKYFLSTVKNINIPSSSKITISPLTIRTCLLVLQGKQASQHQRMAKFYSCIFNLKIKTPLKIMRCLRGSKSSMRISIHAPATFGLEQQGSRLFLPCIRARGPVGAPLPRPWATVTHSHHQ